MRNHDEGIIIRMGPGLGGQEEVGFKDAPAYKGFVKEKMGKIGKRHHMISVITFFVNSIL